MEATRLLGCYLLKLLDAYVENLLTWYRARPLGESGGLSVGKVREYDVETQHLQSCRSHLCRLRIEGLVPTSKYWTYWSHAGDMGSVNRCILLPTDAWLFSTASMAFVREKLSGRPADRSANVLRIVSGALFLRSSWSIQLYWWLHERLSCTKTVCRKHMSGVRGLAREAYMSCVSGSLCRVYIDSNHHSVKRLSYGYHQVVNKWKVGLCWINEIALP
jgi:hypothetical protein